jgi:glutamine---fructose-6-phosphate transaminase (isomerizing)
MEFLRRFCGAKTPNLVMEGRGEEKEAEMENRLWADMMAQGENLGNVVANLYGPERERLERAAEFLAGDGPVVLTGVASAEYLCMPAAAYLGQRGRTAFTLCAADALYTCLPALGAARVVLNTRSGETAEVVRLARALKDAGIPFLALTNEPESTAARLAEHVLWANTRKDDLVSINVVTGMMTATLALAAAVCGELDDLRAEFERLSGMLADCVQRAAGQADAFERLLGGLRPVYQLYRGASKGAANCARLVLEEVARTPGVAMEAAEFRQGPNEVIDERFGAVVYVPASKLGELNRALAADILQCGGRVLLVGEANGMAHPNLAVFPLPEVAEALRPVLEVVPAQLLAYARAQAQGYEPGTTRYITKVILTETGISNQI